MSHGAVRATPWRNLSRSDQRASSALHPGKVLLSAMQAVGHTGNTFGEVTGNVPELFG